MRGNPSDGPIRNRKITKQRIYRERGGGVMVHRAGTHTIDELILFLDVAAPTAKLEKRS